MRNIAHIVLTSALPSSSPVAMATDKPNILVVFTDDAGIWNHSAYARGRGARGY